jgi:hypothetical protein
MADFKALSHYQVHNDYYTPTYAWEWISHLLPKDKVLWEACMLHSEGSASMDVLKRMNLKVVGDYSWDYFDMKDKVEYDYILTNIPFETELKKRMLSTMVAEGKPFITIMNATNLFSNYLHEIFEGEEEHIQVIYPKGKIHFHKREGDELNYRTNTSFYCVYFCYKMNLPHRELFLQ